MTEARAPARLGNSSVPGADSVPRRMAAHLMAWVAVMVMRPRRAGARALPAHSRASGNPAQLAPGTGSPLSRGRADSQRSLWPPGRLAVGSALAVAAVAAGVLLLDSWAVGQFRILPYWLATAFDEITDFGKSSWFLVPTGALLAGIAAMASPALGRMTYLVLIALAARIGFVFLAIMIPSLFTTIVKRMIGRARPLRIEGHDVYFAPFSWSADFASMPSGHSTTAFAAAVALGALFPRARVVLWIYAVIIAASRVVLTAHYPSDVIAGAMLGACLALWMRRWFAVRRLAFTMRRDGSVKALPGPSLQRIKKVARRLTGQ